MGRNLPKERIWKLLRNAVIWRKEIFPVVFWKRKAESMSRIDMEEKMGKKMKVIAFLWKEKEYAEALLEHLMLKYEFVFISTDQLDSDVEEADLILAEEGWFDEIRHRDELWNKTIFFMEQKPYEIPMTRNEFPYLVWKYDGFSRIRHRIAEAMEALCGAGDMEEDEPPILAVGAWNYADSDAWELARELADQIKDTVLYMNLEKYTGEDMRASLELSYSLEDLLYYALDRMELEGIEPIFSIRSILDVKEKVCSLPRFKGYNPLLKLKDRQWKLLLPALCQASEAAAIVLWTGRTEMDHCAPFGGKSLRCIYVKPGDLTAEEGKRWDQMKEWMEGEGPAMIQSEIHMADSWSEAFEVITEYGRELA